MSYPSGLQDIVDFFIPLSEQEKRENLIHYAESAAKQRPREGEAFDLEDVRKDEECTDTVGIYLQVSKDQRVQFRVNLGPQVQTLTRAMTAILCQGLNGARLEEVIAVPQDFVPAIVGADLVRVRSQTVYYVLSRMKGACQAWQRQQRATQG